MKRKVKVKRSPSVANKIMALCLVLTICASVIVGAVCIGITQMETEEMVATELTSLAINVAETVEQSTNADLSFLDGLAMSKLVYDMDDDPIAQKQALIDIAQKRGISDLGFAGKDGMTLTANLEKWADLNERAYYKEAMNGKRFISDPLEDQTIPGRMIMLFSVPVHENGDVSAPIKGVLYQLVEGNYLSNITNKVAFGKTGTAYMINNEGTNIAHYDEQKVISKENPIELFSDNPAFASLIAAVKREITEENGYATYVYNGNEKCVGFARATDNDWHVVITVNKSELFEGQNTSIKVSIIVVILAIIIGSVVSYLFSKKMTAPIKLLGELNDSLAKGDLTQDVDGKTKRQKDEIGQMASATDTFIGQLKSVIGKTLESVGTIGDISSNLKSLTNESAETTDNVSQAVEGISVGAVSQAEDVEKAATEMNKLGDAVDGMKKEVDGLLMCCERMITTEKESMKALMELIESNDKTSSSVSEVAVRITDTSEATKKINEAAMLITDIANQTNLLSLNASIEAARAGESGRGFAVVAQEISSLADQSDKTAKTIQEIIDELLVGATQSQQQMEATMKLVDEQSNKLRNTRDNLNAVDSDMVTLQANSKNVLSSTEVCSSVKDSVFMLITNLSAISEENAASTEETNASMQELNANINLINDAAESLHEVADKLEEQMKFWKM